jgi:hypothetical protein
MFVTIRIIVLSLFEQRNLSLLYLQIKIRYVSKEIRIRF